MRLPHPAVSICQTAGIGVGFKMFVRVLCLLGLLTAAGVGNETERLRFPTANHALAEGRMETFFMGVDREGDRFWQGGTFGFTRSPLDHAGDTIFTQFHEGTDIAPVQRDAAGQPLDEVLAMATGKVVLAEPRGGSGYGNQVLLRHDWRCGPIFTRYAHLAQVSVQVGDRVDAGQVLGVLGSSGGRFDPARAHLHVEVGLLLNANLSEDFRYRPLNLAVLNPEPLLLASLQGPLDLPARVRAQSVDFIVETPSPGLPDLLRRHPWLAGETLPATVAGWRLHCTAWGLPVRLEPLTEVPPEVQVTWVRPWQGLHSWRTRQLLSGEGPTAKLGPRGELFLEQLFQPATP
jgi:hypothetical protein